ncbi:MAG: EAL domain-containing protein [Chloroflexi bacterium]|nr:EAL domain-containing protein [Chloroflexota bacterium]MDA1147196.1 EAL domain-containing protein [Chloroflexota bacterium]
MLLIAGITMLGVLAFVVGVARPGLGVQLAPWLLTATVAPAIAVLGDRALRRSRGQSLDPAAIESGIVATPSGEQFRAVLDAMAEAVLIYDESGVRYVNAPGAELHGTDPEILMLSKRAQDFVEYLDADGGRAVYAELPTLKTFIKNRAHPNEVIGLRRLRDDHLFWVIASASPLAAQVVPDPVGRQVIVTYTDITERRRLESELASAHHSAEKLAKFDGLTGLPNRNHTVDFLIEEFSQAQDEGRRVALFFVDIDHFKDVNDSSGHMAGDALLRQVSERFRRVVRSGDLVGRFGGDEFAFVLRSVGSADEAAEVAERVLEAMRKPFSIEGRSLQVSVSIGVSLSSDTGSSVFELLREADTAMYLTKALGRNGYQFFTPELSESSQRRVALLHRVREALRTDGFELHYQPIVDRAGETIAVEALLRCDDALLGQIPAVELIATARAAGLMPDVGWWVLETAIGQLAAWRAAGATFRMAVNVDPEQLRDPMFVPRIERLLVRHGLPVHALELELTEQGLVDDEVGAKTVRALRSLGVGIAIDDFGTGYSALTYLMKLPISTVKLDRSFIQQTTTEVANRAVAGHVIELAHSLHLTVVAEGVEDEATLQFLRDNGCDAFQGYLFSRALRPAALEAYLSLSRAA